MALACFASCNTDKPPAEETTAPRVRKYDVEDSVLKVCIGQADENGVYVIPETVTMIGESAFAGDETLKEVVIGPHVKAIGSGAFRGCTSLKKVTIAEGVESVGSYAFYACSALEEISFPSTVERLESYTFYGCENLESLSLEHIKYIEDYAMWYCVSLEKVTLSSELSMIDSWAFAQCQKLEEINIGDCTRLAAIGDYAFADCAMLTDFVIPDGTQAIGKLVFYGCSRLTDITIPDSLSAVDFGAFTYTPWYQEREEDYLIVGNGVLIKCTVHPMYLDLADKGIRYIGGAAFRNAVLEDEAAEYGYKYAADLERIVIPEGVVGIGTSAFAGCVNLKEVTLPSTVEQIGDGAFNLFADVVSDAKLNLESCTKLESIGSYAFYGCGGIEEIRLPMSVRYVGEYAFAGTSAYDNFMEKAAAAETEAERYLISGDGVLVAAYVANGQTAIHIPEGVKVIAGTTFCGWDTPLVPSDDDEFTHSGRSKYNISYKVTSLELPSTLETICDKAFFRMTKIVAVVLPDSLKTIGTDAFAFCGSLSNLSGGSSVKEIASGAFRYCTALRHFQISSNTEKLGTNVFSGCSALVSVYFPKTLDDAGEDMFTDGCTALREVRLAPAARPRIYLILGEISQDLSVVYYKD